MNNAEKLSDDSDEEVMMHHLLCISINDVDYNVSTDHYYYYYYYWAMYVWISLTV